MHTFPEISAAFEDFLQDPNIFPAQPENLYAPCRYLLEAGGKRIRPALCLMGHELFNELNNEAFHAACALELFHNFTLIHDDIIDEAPVRRGNPTVHKQYGMTAGILSGDVMCILAYRQLTCLRPENLVRILPVFNKMAAEICEGQQIDFEFELREEVSIHDYLKMIELKTSVLLATALQIGAITGGGAENEVQALYDFGKYLGIAFQLQDDYLDIFGLPEQTGKQPGGDILASKKTIHYIHYQNIAGSDKSKLFKTIYNHNEPDKVRKITNLLKDAGVDIAVSEMVKNYTQKALDALNKTTFPEERMKPLVQLFNQLMYRKS